MDGYLRRMSGFLQGAKDVILNNTDISVSNTGKTENYYVFFSQGLRVKVFIFLRINSNMPAWKILCKLGHWNDSCTLINTSAFLVKKQGHGTYLGR